MGINVSRHAVLVDNEYLIKFVGKEHISPNDTEFWNSFLQYQIALPNNSQDQLNLDSRLETLCQNFLSHNLSTGNFGSLLTVFFNKVKEVLELSDQDSVVHIWHAFNALFIIRCLIKYMIETGSEYQLLQHFEAIPALQKSETTDASTSTTTTATTPTTTKQPNVTVNNQSSIINIDTYTTSLNALDDKHQKLLPNKQVDGSKFESFIDAVINLIVVIPVKEFTYHLHLEAVNLIIVLFSIHLFSQQSNDKSMIFKTIYKNQNANTLMSALLHFVSRMVEVPQSMFGFTSTGSIVYGIAEQILSIFTFRKSHQDFQHSNDLPTTFNHNYPLANQSLLLILILTNHHTSKENPYRISLFGCSDSQESPKDGSTFKIDFSQLYNTLCRIVTIDQATLLLYLLLHRNQRFYKYVMAQENLQQLVIPILQTLYNAPDSTSHHIYMSLIVLLILSEDDGFNKCVHQIILKNIYWYTERSISEISLGGLLILVVIRTIQYNMLKMRDKYLHTNCLAALANMSGQFHSIHPYVAQRLVSLFETLAKKHSRLDDRLKQPNSMDNPTSTTSLLLSSSSSASTQTSSNVENGGSTPSTTINIANPNTSDDMLQDLNVLEEVLRMVLEILNSCLSHQLVYCPNLVYTLLYKRHVFEIFRSHHAFQDIIQNIDMVVGFFSSRLQRVQEQRGELGVSEVLEVISKGASQWSSDRLRKFPDLKFKYIEEDAPEEFFIPYVWTLVTKYGCVHFSSESMKTITELSC